MAWAPDSAAVVLLALTLACALLVVELALPTSGIAGGAAVVLGAVGVVSLVEHDHRWWPLLLVGLAHGTWAGILLAWVPSRLGQVLAATAFAAGGSAYGILADDPAAVALAVGGAVLLALGFRPLQRAATTLLTLAPQHGMESLLDRRATVVRWAGRSGTVRLDGSLWSATSAEPLEPGTDVVVVDTVGMTVDVAPRSRTTS